MLDLQQIETEIESSVSEIEASEIEAVLRSIETSTSNNTNQRVKKSRRERKIKMSDQTVKYMNEKPEVPAETKDIKYVIKEVSRTVKTVNGEETTALYVLSPIALTLEGMVAITSNDASKALDYFNTGYFSSQRTKASNELSGGSEEDKAFARIAKAVKNLPLFSGKSDDEITQTLRENPALMALFATK